MNIATCFVFERRSGTVFATFACCRSLSIFWWVSASEEAIGENLKFRNLGREFWNQINFFLMEFPFDSPELCENIDSWRPRSKRRKTMFVRYIDGILMTLEWWQLIWWTPDSRRRWGAWKSTRGPVFEITRVCSWHADKRTVRFFLDEKWIIIFWAEIYLTRLTYFARYFFWLLLVFFFWAHLTVWISYWWIWKMSENIYLNVLQVKWEITYWPGIFFLTIHP